jgi:hypothetical protein
MSADESEPLETILKDIDDSCAIKPFALDPQAWIDLDESGKKNAADIPKKQINSRKRAYKPSHLSENSLDDQRTEFEQLLQLLGNHSEPLDRNDSESEKEDFPSASQLLNDMSSASEKASNGSATEPVVQGDDQLDQVFSRHVLARLKMFVEKEVTMAVDEFERRWEQTPYMALFAKEDSYRVIVAQIAHDFKRYFFDKWAYELRSQRPQHSRSAILEMIDNRIDQSEQRLRFSMQQRPLSSSTFEIDEQFEQIRAVLNEEFVELRERVQSDCAARLNLIEKENANLYSQIRDLQSQIDKMSRSVPRYRAHST